MSDLRFGFRSLARAPRFALMAVLVLALGIGANSAMFTVVNSVLLQPLPYRDPARIAVILASIERTGGTLPLMPGDFQDYSEQNRTFEQIAAAHVWGPTLTGVDRAERLDGLRASANLFDVLQVAPAFGRFFSADDGRPDSPDVVVLTHRLFEQRFGADPSIIGRSITLDGQKHTVIGVAPKGFNFPPFWAASADLFSVGVFRAAADGGRGPGYLRLFGRLKPGVSFEQANADIKAIAARLAATYPRSNAGLTATATPIHEMAVGKIRPILLVLFGAVACTLLIACANIANLLIARASARRKEIAIRQSLGASRAHLLRQFLAESLVLSAAGGLAGLALAWWIVPVFVASVPELNTFHLPRRTEIHLSGAVAAFNVALCLITAVFCGLATAWQAARADVNADLKENGRGAVAARSGRRFRSVLSAVEVAVALLLVVGAGLLAESYRKMRSIDPGFDATDVLAINVGLAASEHAAPNRRAQFYREAMNEFAALPGVKAVGAVNHVPFAGDRFGTQLTLQDRPALRPEDTPSAVYRVAMPGYLRTIGIRLLEGRDFKASDDANAPGVVIVNASAARRWWPGERAIGKRIHRGDAQAQRPWLTVVGLIGDVKQADWSAPAESEIYLPFEQDPDYRTNPQSFLTMTLVLRAQNAASLTPAIRERVARIDRNISVPHVFVMDQVIRDITWQPRTSMLLVLFFAGVAALLAAVGVYAVMSFLVTGRTQEIGVRMALGARRRDVLRMVVRDAAGPVGAGIAAGVVMAATCTRVLSTMLYEVKPMDPVVFCAATALVATAAAAACFGPAKRAAGLDPLTALRND